VAGEAPETADQTGVGGQALGTGEAIAIGSAAVSAFVAVTVSWLAFRFANRQEHIRWLRATRVALYQRMINESQACIAWVRASARGSFDRSADHRLSPVDRRNLAYEALLFASDEVFEAWKEACPNDWDPLVDDDWHEANVMLAGITLIATIRQELGVDSRADALMRRR